MHVQSTTVHISFLTEFVKPNSLVSNVYKTTILLSFLGGEGSFLIHHLFRWVLKVKVKVTQLCPTLCNPRVYTVHGILQARILE